MGVGNEDLAIYPSVGSTVGGVTAWTAATAFKATQLVSFGGMTWSAIDNHTSSTTFPTDYAHWLALPAPLLYPDQSPTVAPADHIISRFASGHGWTGTGVTSDATQGPFGGASLKITTLGAGVSVNATGPSITPLDMSADAIRIWLKVDDPTKLKTTSCLFFLYGPTLSDSFAIAPSFTFNTGEFEPFTIPQKAWGSAGSPNFNNIIRGQLRIVDQSTGAVNVWCGGYEGVKAA